MDHKKPKYLLDCLDDVRRRLGRYDRAAAFFDLDGTLAEITPTPGMTQIEQETRSALQSLLVDPAYRVIIVSGRGLQDVKRIVKLSGIVYAGNHGLEIEGPGFRFIHTEARDHAGLITVLAAQLESRLRSIPGALVESKTLTASVHYRLVEPSEVDLLRRVVEEVISPFRNIVHLEEGRCVLELRPAVSWDKGAAAHWVLHQTGHDPAATIFAGDDRTDEDGFAALPDGITIKVGEDTNSTAARYFVKGPKDIRSFIQYLGLKHSFGYGAL